MIPTPLAHDPTHNVELSRWWSNGTQLLRLDQDASYALFETQNRYDAPIERGRWARSSYAVLWLEPYNTSQADPRRVSITRLDGKLALVVPRYQPMSALSRPPLVLEDRLVGQWQGEWGTLNLTSDMRYVYSPQTGERSADDQRRIAQMRKGSWRVVEGALVLRPDVAGADSIRLPLIFEGDEASITAPTGSLSPLSAEPR